MARQIEGVDSNRPAARSHSYKGPVLQFKDDNFSPYGQLLADGESGMLNMAAAVQADTEIKDDEIPLTEALSESRSFKGSTKAKLLPVIEIVERECRDQEGNIVEPLDHRMSIVAACLGSLEYRIRIHGMSRSKSNAKELSIESIAKALTMKASDVRRVLDHPEEYAYVRDTILHMLADEANIVSLKP